MTLASYRNGVFYSIRLKFRIDVVEHLLITQVYFWNDNKMLKVKNSTSKKKYENLCLRVYIWSVENKYTSKVEDIYKFVECRYIMYVLH